MKLENILKTGLANTIFQIVYLLFMFIIGYSISLAGHPSLKALLLVVIVFVPSFIWTLFFYLQDRPEPEPASFIISAFIAGMAAASLGAIPLYNIIFHVQEWIYASTLLFILGSFFIKGFVASFFLYIVLRYGFYPLKEFDNPPDGMIYGATVGAGFAFVSSLFYLWDHPSFTLFVVAFTATVNILAYSAVGSLIGYMIGRSKFQGKNIDVSSTIGVALGVFLIGIYHILGELFFLSGIQHAFWLCFILVLIYSLIIQSFCFLKIKKQIKRGIEKEVNISKKPARFTTLIILIFFLGAIFISQLASSGKKYNHEEYGISFSYPYSLSPFSLFGGEKPKISLPPVSEILFSGKNNDPSFLFSVKFDSKENYEGNRGLLRYVEVSQTENFRIEDYDFGHKKGTRILYSYLERTTEDPNDFPKLIRVVSDIILHKEKIFILTYKADSSQFENGFVLYTKIIKSLEWN
jgi:RsiW-degrading membrane proteinase PrsW (M82 family)